MSRPRSLYRDYPEYPFRRPPELDGAAPRYDVVIVGGGPTGLECALELIRHGVRPVVIEADDTLAGGSRAICVSRRSMEILQQIGVIDAFLAKALPWTRGRSFYRGRVVFELEMPHSPDERYYPMANLQQCYLEQLLIERLEALGVDIRWQSRVVGVEQCAEAVQLDVETPAGGYRLESRYVVAADGAQSAMRTFMGLRLAGTSYSGQYLIADILMRSPHPAERRAWFDPDSNRGSTVLMHKQPDDLWRIDYQLREEDDVDAELDPQRIRRRIQTHLDMIGETTPWQLDWYSLYRAHCRCLDRYLHGRVVFVGDAAHLVPIFGVRGLNSGLADGNNLGWKLAYRLRGEAGPTILASYAQERRAATLEIFREAGRSTAFMTPPTRGYRLMRDAALGLAISHDYTRALVNPRQSQPYDYVDSALNSGAEAEVGFSAGPRLGAPLANLRLADGGFLLDRVGSAFTGLYFTESGKLPEELAYGCHTLAVGGEPFTLILVSRKAVAVRGCELVLDARGSAFERYAAEDGTFFLSRPDGHICLRTRRLQRGLIAAAQRRALGLEALQREPP